MNEITQTDIDNLADVAWFIKGWVLSFDCPFTAFHSVSLSKVMENLKADKQAKKSKEAPDGR